MAQKYVYNGTTRLSNIPQYIADELRVPVAAIDLKFKWIDSKSGEIQTIEGEDLARPLRELRLLWDV